MPLARPPKRAAKGKIVLIRFTKAAAEQLAAASSEKDQSLSERVRRNLVGLARAVIYAVADARRPLPID